MRVIKSSQTITTIAAKMALSLLRLVLISSAGLLTAHGQGYIPPPALIPASLNGACEMPPNGSAYTGTATFYNLYGSSGPNWTCSVTLPTGFSAVDVGIYGSATPFQTGPLVFDLGQPGLITNIVEGPIYNEYSTNVVFGCVTNLTLTPQQINDLNAGLLYVNVTSAAYPGGEIRGQFSTQPTLSQPAFQNGNGVEFNVFAQQQSYEVQVSTDLLNWTTFTNVNTTNIIFQIVDTEATNTGGSQRFYRIKAPFLQVFLPPPTGW